MLQPGEIHLWFVPLTGDASLAVSRRPLLSAAERALADRFKFERDRLRYVFAHAALRELLAPFAALPPSALRIVAGDRGKPRFDPDHGLDLQFNLSHSGDWALVGLTARHALGVDVESNTRNVEHDDIVQRFFSAAEQRAYHALDPIDRSAGFFRAWTRKEAYVKARGDGLSHASERYVVDFVRTDSAHLLADELDPSAPGRFKLHAVRAPVGYTAACACASPSSRVVAVHSFEL